jgi:hypothetical protein
MLQRVARCADFPITLINLAHLDLPSSSGNFSNRRCGAASPVRGIRIHADKRLPLARERG